LSFSAFAALPHVWAVSGVGGISAVNEPTEVANSICQIKVMIQYVISRNVHCSTSAV